MTARNTCAKIKEAETATKIAGKVVDGLTTMAPPNWFGNKNRTETENNNITNLGISIKDVTEIENECKNKVESGQINELRQNPDCLRTISAMCGLMSTDDAKLKCAREYLDSFKIKNISQENKNKIQQVCVINSITDKLIKQEPNIDSIANVMQVQKASGLLNTNTSITENCNEVNMDMSSEQFLTNINKCLNETISKQKNAIDVCGAIDIKQENTTNILNDCLVRNGVKVVSEQKPKVATGSDTRGNQETSNTALFIALFIVLGIVAVIAIFIVVKFYGAKGGKMGGQSGGYMSGGFTHVKIVA
jgi:hypothetical protein